MPTLREIGELEAIRRLSTGLGGAGVVVGPGDDAAVLRPTAELDLVATTDTFVEGRHYRDAWLSPAQLGSRLAAANLSDVAAMGARPRWATLAMCVRTDHDLEVLVEFERGLVRSLGEAGTSMVGGNLTGVTGEESFTLTLLGEVARGGAWTRAGARAGDLLAATGTPGRAGAAVRWLSGSVDPPPRELLAAWTAPRVRLALVERLSTMGVVTAAIDLSDGLAGDLAHLCRASGIGAELAADAWPPDAALDLAAEWLEIDVETLRLGPSDDYELVLAVDPAGRAACEGTAAALGVPLTFFGRCVTGSGIAIVADDGQRRVIAASGFDHFGGSRT